MQPITLKAIAVGGPLDGVEITSGAAWDGRIAVAKQRKGASTVYHDGYYQYENNNWCWHDGVRRPIAPAKAESIDELYDWGITYL